jgi:CRP-like cAMP-binding protein
LEAYTKNARRLSSSVTQISVSRALEPQTPTKQDIGNLQSHLASEQSLSAFPKKLFERSRNFFQKRDASESEIADTEREDAANDPSDTQGETELLGMSQQVYNIRQLQKGTFFGEVGLITKLKRTTTVTSADYCTFAEMKKSAIKQAKHQYPSIYLNLRSHLSTYDDFDFQFRHRMVKNIPFFRQIDDFVVQLVVYLLRPRFYDKGSLIVKQGDEVNEILLLRSGSIVVEIPDPANPGKSLYIDWLNEGSCFCVHSAFNQDMIQHVNFRATTGCIIDTLQVKSLRKLEK